MYCRPAIFVSYPIITIVFSRLLSISSRPLPLDAPSTRDAPQAHALHTLRALAHDAALAQETAPHLHDMLRSAVRGLGAPLWAVRNAALQLFGALAPRLVDFLLCCFCN